MCKIALRLVIVPALIGMVYCLRPLLSLLEGLNSSGLAPYASSKIIQPWNPLGSMPATPASLKRRTSKLP